MWRTVRTALTGIAGTAVVAGAVVIGVGTPANAEPYQPSCGGDQILNPEYGTGFGVQRRCVDTLQSGVPGAYGPDGYTPCTGDAASIASPFCSDPNGSF